MNLKYSLFLLAAATATMASTARDFEYNGLKFEVIDETAKTCRTIAGASVSDALVIPAKAWDGTDSLKVTAIGTGSFQRSSITSVSIPEGVTEIGATAFYMCKSMTQASIPQSVTSIGDNGFRNCTSLASVTLPQSVQSIGKYCFSACPFTQITIPASVATIGDAVFARCPNLAEIKVDPASTSFCAVDGALLNADRTYMYAYAIASAATSYVMPSTVTATGEGAMNMAEKLENITLSANLQKIGMRTFTQCTALKSIVIPEKVTEIGSYAFSICYMLNSVTLPASLTTLGSSVFSDDTEIKQVVYNCTTPVTADAGVFNEMVYPAATLYLPKTVLDKGALPDPWNLFTKKAALETLSVESIAADNSQAEVYTLGGIKLTTPVSELPRGIYIVRQGIQVTKLVK